MRNLLMALVVVALVAAPTMATVSVKLVPSATTIDNKGLVTATVEVQMQGSTKSPGALGGDINVTGTGGVVSSNFAWIPQFTAAISPSSGAALADGGWGGFGSQQALPNDKTVGLAPNWWTVATFKVTGVTAGDVAFTITPKSYAGFGPIKSVASPTIDSTLGTATGFSMTVTPEPITMALLAMGGLFMARRRSH